MPSKVTRALAVAGALAALTVSGPAAHSQETPKLLRSVPASLVVDGTNVQTGKNQEIVTAAAGVPSPSTSFYVFGSYIDVCGLNASTECPLYNDGAIEAAAATGGITILDFGAPCFEPATLAWGTQLFNSQSCTPDGTLVILAQAWLRGYQANPKRPATPGYILAAGTSNSLTAAIPGNTMTPAQMSLHGQAWFVSVVNPIATAAQALPAPVAIWAGNDIEQSSDGNWYDGPTTRAWVDGYSGASKATKPCRAGRTGLMVDYGDYVPNEPGWSPADVYYVSWQAAPACPVPEIYNTVNGAEWQGVNRYAESVGLEPMQFTGVLSLDGAPGTLTAAGSWTALRNATGQSAPFLSVIGETSAIPAEVPDAAMAVTAIPGPGLATVSWTAPAWDGGAAITSYTVTAYTAGKRPLVLIFTGSPLPETVIVDGLANGTTYTFDVTATNRVGPGPRSLPSTAITPSALFHY
ncbi:MAG TPA: fibronectin type III domain-containing protein [Gemmatimonadales bacterium]|nr:fibronectin type III domain-containing protein [Gemmatimonadales bacterium]